MRKVLDSAVQCGGVVIEHAKSTVALLAQDSSETLGASINAWTAGVIVVDVDRFTIAADGTGAALPGDHGIPVIDCDLVLPTAAGQLLSLGERSELAIGGNVVCFDFRLGAVFASGRAAFAAPGVGYSDQPAGVELLFGLVRLAYRACTHTVWRKSYQGAWILEQLETLGVWEQAES